VARANNNGRGSILELLPRLQVARASASRLHLGNATLANDHPLGAENQIIGCSAASRQMVPPPAKDDPSRKLKRVHAYLLLVLGVALIGAAITVMGLATTSPTTVGVGAGIIAAAGLLSVVFAFVGFSFDQNEDAEGSGQSTDFEPPIVDDPYRTDQRPIWPPKTSRRPAHG
jgi:hypothetical protein